MDMTESLFSLELHVESVNRLKVSCVIPAVSFRLLDFPTLIIHQIKPASVLKLREKAQVQGISKISLEAEFRDRNGNILFSKGKSCLFKSNVQVLQRQLQVTPLYVMVLDVWPKKPKLVGSTMIPLKKTIDKIAADVKTAGVSVPSISQQQGTYEVFNLMGSVIGTIKLALRVLSLGGCLTPHIPAKSIMTRESELKVEQPEKNTVERDVAIEDLEGISLDDEPNPQPSIPTMVENTGTQTTVSIPKPQRVVTVKPPCVEDNDLAIIANTVCPPPLYYHVMSHAENTGLENERKKVKKGKSIGDHNPDDVDFTYYKPDIVLADGSCGCVSVYVQTEGVQDSGPSLVDKTNGESTQNKIIHNAKPNPDNLPLLNALLEELTYLRAERKDDKKGIESGTTLNKTILGESKVPPKTQPKVRECCAKVIAQKSGLLKKQNTDTAVLTPKRVKFKQTNLAHGMTRTHLMRLEMNQRTKQPPHRLNSTRADQSISNNVSKKHPLGKPYGLNFKADLGRTLTLVPNPPVVDKQNVISTEVQTDNGFGQTVVLTKDQEEEKEEEEKEEEEEDSIASSRSHSSHKSVEIFLPQMEGESDISDDFDVTNLEEDRFALGTTYKKYGHTGIPDLPESSKKIPNQSHLFKRSPDQSEITGESLHQSDLMKKTNQSESSVKGSDQSESPRRSPDQSIPTRSPTPGSTRSPDLGRRRSVTSQTARSRTSTALSMYSDDFEECPVWDSSEASDNDSSYSSSISRTSYYSIDSQDKEKKGRNNPHEPTKSYYSPSKSKDFKNGNISEGSPPLSDKQDLKSATNKEYLYDSLNSVKSEKELSENEQKNVLHLPKPANDLGYTF